MLVVKHKTGFKSTSPVTTIYRDGLPFYKKTKKDNPFLTFNLPPGKYDIMEGNISPLSIPVVYKKIVLPPPNSVTYFNGKIKIYFIDNPNKCSVDLSNKNITKIYFDHSFKDYPKFVIIWICGHELYHYFYKGQGQISERNCDHGSANVMLEMGYNPSQIDAAIVMAISNGYKALIRKQMLYENLILIQPHGNFK